MSLIANATVLAGRLLPGAEARSLRRQGLHDRAPDPSATWKEIIRLDRIDHRVRAALQVRRADRPQVFRRPHRRRAGPLDDSAAAKVAADTEAARIREAQGDIEAERARLHAEAETQAAALLIDGRARLDVEMAELEARAETDIAAAAGRSSDELRAEIARHSSVAIDRIVDETLDDATHQALIEGFIQRVGASTGASA